MKPPFPDALHGESSGIIRVHKSRDYSTLCNAGLRDVRLSFGARGILAYLLTKPDNWQVKTPDLINQSPHGETAILSMLRELEECGYLLREKRRGKGGRFEWHTQVYESPRDPKAPLKTRSPRPASPPAPLSPDRGFPGVDKPGGANPDGASPGSENPGIKERKREEPLKKEKLSEGGWVGESEKARAGESLEKDHPPTPTFSDLVLNPDPRSAEDTRVLAAICSVNLTAPDTRDMAAWPLAVATVREAMPDHTPGERAQALRDFNQLWRDGGRRGSPYLAQITAHWYRVMDGAINGSPPEASQAPNNPRLERVRAARAANAAGSATTARPAVLLNDK